MRANENRYSKCKQNRIGCKNGQVNKQAKHKAAQPLKFKSSVCVRFAVPFNRPVSTTVSHAFDIRLSDDTFFESHDFHAIF